MSGYECETYKKKKKKEASTYCGSAFIRFTSIIINLIVTALKDLLRAHSIRQREKFTSNILETKTPSSIIIIWFEGEEKL